MPRIRWDQRRPGGRLLLQDVFAPLDRPDPPGDEEQEDARQPSQAPGERRVDGERASELVDREAVLDRERERRDELGGLGGDDDTTNDTTEEQA